MGIGSVAVIYAAARAGTITARLLGGAPLVWIRKRSYAIYLWHCALVAVTLGTAPAAEPAGIQVDHSKNITIKI